MPYNGLAMPTNTPTQLSFSETTPSALDSWASNLPLVNTTATAEQLQTACQEITALHIPSQLRYELLEALRPLVHYVCSRLHKNTRETLAPAHVLAHTLTGGYEVAFEQARLTAMQDKDQRDILIRSAHRLLSELGRVGLYCFQQYRDLPTNYWNKAHTTYLVIESMELLDSKQKDTDDSDHATSIAHVYLRNLLFACCKPNQLNFQDLSFTFIALEAWAAQASLEDYSDEGLLVVDMASNTGPSFRHKLNTSQDLRVLNTEVLAYETEAYLNDVSTNLPVPEFMHPELIQHLLQSWSVIQPRHYRRITSQGRVKLCMGMRAAHYFLSGGVDFTDQISNTEAVLRREVNPFLDVDFESINSPPEDDPWSQAHDLKRRIPENHNVEDPDAILLQHATRKVSGRKFDHYELLSLDTSPGGYRVQWEDTMPTGAHVGEIVGLREEVDSRWCIGVLRWIAGHGENGQMGVQLLAPRAIPLALRPIQKKGGATGYSRGFLLPALDAIGQVATMITPRLPFVSGQKISIQRQGLQSTGLLMEPVLNTESFNQFTFRMLDGYLENPTRTSKMDALTAMTREDSTQGS
ncbi:MAG: hypothetical protein ACI96M_003499 [Candidatus Azotimanducaceae bacterium]|jgi:hypothetical protein